MFGFFRAKPRCPIDAPSRAWLDRRWGWLEESFGRDRAHNAQVVLPSPDFFPDPYDGSEADARQLLVRVCEYMAIDPLAVRLSIYRESRPLFGASEGTAGLYHAELGGFRVWLEAGQLADPLAAVATLAHEVAHVHLLGHGRVRPDEADHEPLTDLLTVFLGLGVFTANAALREASWNQGHHAFHTIGKQGYLAMPEYGYALAKFARAREEDGRAWARELRLDVRAAFRRSLALLEVEAAEGL